MYEDDFNVKEFRSNIQNFLKKFIATLSAYSGLPSINVDKNFRFKVDNYTVSNSYVFKDYFWANKLKIKHKRKKIFICKWESELVANFTYQAKIKEIILFDNENYVFLRNLFDLIKAKIEILELE